MQLDKRIIGRAFSRQAGFYDRQAVMQRQSGKRLLTLLWENLSGRSILEIGPGSGFLTEHLINRGARIFTCDLAHGMNRFLMDKLRNAPNSLSILTADAEYLPFVPGRFELVISGLCLQWVEDLERIFAEIMRMLAPGGSFIFSIFGEKTLYELRASFHQAAVLLHRPDHSQKFSSLEDIKNKLSQTGFTDIIDKRQVLEREYDDLKALLRSLKMIGAVNASNMRPRGLGQRRLLEETESFYRRNFSRQDKLRTTYQIYYIRVHKEG